MITLTAYTCNIFLDCISSFNPLNQTTEGCLGDTLIFECSTTAGSISEATVFQGDLLDCNEIALIHNRFSNMSVATSGICNTGRVRGQSAHQWLRTLLYFTTTCNGQSRYDWEKNYMRL